MHETTISNYISIIQDTYNYGLIKAESYQTVTCVENNIKSPIVTIKEKDIYTLYEH